MKVFMIAFYIIFFVVIVVAFFPLVFAMRNSQNKNNCRRKKHKPSETMKSDETEWASDSFIQTEDGHIAAQKQDALTCPNCGGEIVGNVKICSICGQKLRRVKSRKHNNFV